MVECVKILVASMTGNAEFCAEAIAEVLGEAGLTATVLPMDDLTPSVFRPGPVYIICSSTYGQGDVPDNGQALYDALEAEAPDLSGIRYGVFGLGDRTYADTFAFGPTRFDERLRGLGARRIGAVHRHDAASGTLPEDEAEDWARQWVETMPAQAEAA